MFCSKLGGGGIKYTNTEMFCEKLFCPALYSSDDGSSFSAFILETAHEKKKNFHLKDGKVRMTKQIKINIPQNHHETKHRSKFIKCSIQ